MTSIIGFIGLGNMGAPMATNIVAAGFDVVCFDAAGTVERAPAGAVVAKSAGAVAMTAETILLSLPDGDAMTSVVASIASIAAGSTGQVRTVVDLSTVGPEAAADAAALLGAVGVAYVDGPVSGGAAGARARTISLMFGGPADVLESHRALLSTFVGNIYHVGDHAGQGQAMKLLNNFLSATALAATSEAISFGIAMGLDQAIMIDVLNASTGRNSATVDKFPHRIMTNTFDAGFHTALMTKDVRLYLDEVGRHGTADAIGAAVVDVWTRADAAMPKSDFTEIWKFVSAPPTTSAEGDVA